MGVQVQTATKNGQGNSLSILNRQFISFSYGGKNIEDFDLLAVFSNDRLNKEIYAPFNDTTTEQAELDGQMFWRSNFKAGQLSFNLATDGMTSIQLEEFKNWFQPGIERELILSEYHNRKILARVANPPQISLLPFEQSVQVKVGEKYYTTKTSLYKGEIRLDFVMDDPYWYSIFSHLDSIEEGFNLYVTPDVVTTKNSFNIEVTQNLDGSLIINGQSPAGELAIFYFSLADTIPMNTKYTISLNNSESFDETQFGSLDMGIRLMNQTQYVSGETEFDRVVSFCQINSTLSSSYSSSLKGFQLIIPGNENLVFNNFSLKPEIYINDKKQEALKIIQEDGVPSKEMFKTNCFLANNYYCSYNDSLISINKNNGYELDAENQTTDTYLYYCGTAPAKPIISFDIEPVINEGTGKISFPNKDENKITYLSIGTGENYKELRFGLPSLFSSYNNALDIALKYEENSSILDLRKELRDFVYDYYTRSYVIALIDMIKNDKERKYADVNGKIKEGFKEYFIDEMKKFFRGSLFCVINCKNGSVTISGKIRQYNGSEMVEINEPITENAGNMIKSNYLTIEKRKLPENGFVTSNQCLMVTTNTKLSNLKINYKYMYL